MSIDYSIIKPVKKDYKDWNTWWQDHCNYLVQKYRNTYGTKKK